MGRGSVWALTAAAGRPMSAMAGGVLAVGLFGLIAATQWGAWPRKNSDCTFHTHKRSPVQQPGHVCKTCEGALCAQRHTVWGVGLAPGIWGCRSCMCVCVGTLGRCQCLQPSCGWGGMSRHGRQR
jgi:hypothetical protein